MATFDNSSLLTSLSLISFQGLFNFTYDTAALNPVSATELPEGYVVQIWDNQSSLNPVTEFEGAIYQVDSAIDMGTVALAGVAYARNEGIIGSFSTPPSFYSSPRRAAVLEVPLNGSRNIYVFMRALDTGAGLAGLAPTMVITASKNGASGAVITPSITDLAGSLGSGWYVLALTSAHFSTLGEMALHITALAALPNDDVIINVIALDKQDAIRASLTSLPNANASAVGGLATITAIGQGPGGQIKANSFNDKYVYDTQGRMTSCRMRVFANKATADTASDSDPDGAHGEVERFRVTVTYNTDSTIKTYEYAKEL